MNELLQALLSQFEREAYLNFLYEMADSGNDTEESEKVKKFIALCIKYGVEPKDILPFFREIVEVYGVDNT